MKTRKHRERKACLRYVPMSGYFAQMLDTGSDELKLIRAKVGNGKYADGTDVIGEVRGGWFFPKRTI